MVRKHLAEKMEEHSILFTSHLYKFGSSKNIEAYERQIEELKSFSVENVLLELARRLEVARFGHLQKEGTQKLIWMVIDKRRKMA